MYHRYGFNFDEPSNIVHAMPLYITRKKII